MTDKTKQLDELKKSIVEDKIGSDLAKEATNLVFGEGSTEAEVMFIGEAPGKNEDILGRPFVGAAGKLLDELLQIINLKRQDVYITNIVKYRPPANRDPYPTEKLEFLPVLKKQIEIIKPLLIVPLGRHSLDSLIPNQKISDCHGQPKRFKGQVYLPLFHPAAALYNSSMKQTLIDDFMLIPKLLNQLRSNTLNIKERITS